jgi:hypothetical protein
MNNHWKKTAWVACLFAIAGACQAASEARDVNVDVDTRDSTITNLPGGSVGTIRGVGLGAELQGGHVTVGARLESSTARDVTVRVRMRNTTITNLGGGDVTVGVSLK